MADKARTSNTSASTNVEDLRAQAQQARTNGDDQRATQLEEQIRQAEAK